MGSLRLNLVDSALTNKTMKWENMNGCDAGIIVTKDSACSLPSLTSPSDSEPSSIFSEDYLQMTDDQGCDCESDDDDDDDSQQGDLSPCSSIYDLERELQKLKFRCNPAEEHTNDDTVCQLNGHCDVLVVAKCPLDSVPVKSTEEHSCPNEQTEEHTENQVAPLVRTPREQGEFDFLHRPAIHRASSVKSCKTPPGSPGRKKVVRFADTLGLDLEDIRHFMKDPPTIPDSALNDLQVRTLACS